MILNEEDSGDSCGDEQIVYKADVDVSTSISSISCNYNDLATVPLAEDSQYAHTPLSLSGLSPRLYRPSFQPLVACEYGSLEVYDAIYQFSSGLEMRGKYPHCSTRTVVFEQKKEIRVSTQSNAYCNTHLS